MRIQITHLGAATTLLEIGGLRLLTDPVFDPPGGRYSFGWGTGSRKLAGPAIAPARLGPIDAVLLSHDHHEDNLDRAGRDFLPSAGQVLTTVSGARRLGGNAVGLAAWQSARLAKHDLAVKVTATPARHGPPLSRPLVGEVIGFVLEWPEQRHGALYISGDTVWYAGVAEVAARVRVGTAMLHLGRASFPITGPLRFTMNAAEGVRAAQALGARTVIPIHYDGWSHFREPASEIGRRFAAAGLGNRLHWLPLGEAAEIDV